MKKERPGQEDKTRRKLNQHHEIDKDLDSPGQGHADVLQVRIELVTFGLK